MPWCRRSWMARKCAASAAGKGPPTRSQVSHVIIVPTSELVPDKGFEPLKESEAVIIEASVFMASSRNPGAVYMYFTVNVHHVMRQLIKL